MKEDSDEWLCVDDLFDVSHPRQAFSGAQSGPAVAASCGDTILSSVGGLRSQWRELVTAAHQDVEHCAALLGVDARLHADVHRFTCELERGCDQFASNCAEDTAHALMPRVCVLSGLIGWLIRDSYDYANVRVVMGNPLITYQLVCAKLADMVIADEIIEQRLIAALAAQRRARANVGWRGVPALEATQNVSEICRCAATVLRLYVEIKAGPAFVQPAGEPPVLTVAQSLLDGILVSLKWGA